MAKKKKPDGPKEYTLKHDGGEYKFKLSAPSSVAQRYSIVNAADGNQIYALFAALGACWRGPGRPKTKIATFKFDFARYGQAVFDEMHDRGLEVDTVVEVAGEAFMLCLQGILSKEDVDAFADFTAAQSEDLIG